MAKKHTLSVLAYAYSHTGQGPPPGLLTYQGTSQNAQHSRGHLSEFAISCHQIVHKPWWATLPENQNQYIQTDCVKYEKYVPTDLCNYLWCTKSAKPLKLICKCTISNWNVLGFNAHSSFLWILKIHLRYKGGSYLTQSVTSLELWMYHFIIMPQHVFSPFNPGYE